MCSKLDVRWTEKSEYFISKLKVSFLYLAQETEAVWAWTASFVLVFKLLSSFQLLCLITAGIINVKSCSF